HEACVTANIREHSPDELRMPKEKLVGQCGDLLTEVYGDPLLVPREDGGAGPYPDEQSGTAPPHPPLRRRMDQQTAMAKSNGSLIRPPPPAEAFYSEVLQLMAQSGIPFLVSGTYALASYTGIDRPTKDVDVFAKAGDALKMLHFCKERGFDVEIVDERWLYRVTRSDLFVDIITNMPTVTTHVTDEWFVNAPETVLFGATVKLVPPTQFVWSKIFVQDHHRYDMADVAHMIL